MTADETGRILRLVAPDPLPQTSAGAFQDSAVGAHAAGRNLTPREWSDGNPTQSVATPQSVGTSGSPRASTTVRYFTRKPPKSAKERARRAAWGEKWGGIMRDIKAGKQGRG